MSGSAQSFQPVSHGMSRSNENISTSPNETAGRNRVLALSVAAVVLIDAGLGLMALSDGSAPQKIAAMFVQKDRAFNQAMESKSREKALMRASLDRPMDQTGP